MDDVPTTGRPTTGRGTPRVCGHGCPDGTAGTAATGFSRRALLKGLGLGALTLTATEAVHTRVALAAPGYTGDVLVVLSLRGGFDGLSAIVPAGDPAYAALRPSIAVPSSVLLPLDATFGLHPAMAPLLPLWKAGTLGAVHGVGQPDATRSHFAAMEEMERAAPGGSLRTGWLDRTLGTRDGVSTFSAVALGATTPQSLAGPGQELATPSLSGFGLQGARDAAERARWARALAELHREGPASITAAGTTALAAAEAVGGLGPKAPVVDYPHGDLGTSLSDLAHLIKGGVGVQVAAVDSGDWDMHENLGGHAQGWMHDKLAELSAALVAFAADLGPLMSGVTLVTLSEFGRRAAENGSGGLDHGHGNLALLMGGGVVGGRVHGRWPGLGGDALVDGALAGTTDYRDVIGEVLRERCGAGSLAEVFPGFAPRPALGVVRAA